MNKNEQQILAVPSNPLARERLSLEVLRQYIDATGVYGRRGDLENDPSFRQVIPYVVINHGRDDKVFFRYQRGKSGGESRLHGDWSIGVGGHVEYDKEVKQPNMQAAEMAAWRELHEEVIFHSEMKLPALELIGYISSDENEVSRVHLGLVYSLSIPKAIVIPNEECIQYPGWVTEFELHRSSFTYEAWSVSAALLFQKSKN